MSRGSIPQIIYTCHDSFPSSSTNTEQTFWTILEVARLGVPVELLVPSVAGTPPPGEAPAVLARYYGASPEALPATLTITALGSRPLRSSFGKGRFDWHLGGYLRRRAAGQAGAATSPPHELIWTRDPLALVSCLRAGLPTLFETYRPDFATRPRFAPWRRACLRSPHLRGVIAHSQLAAQAYVIAGVPPVNCLVAHNGFAPSLLEPRLSRLDARRRLNLPIEGPLAVYAGHTGPEKGVDTLVQMAAAVPSARILIVGASPDSANGRRLLNMAQRAGVKNLLLRPRVPLSEVAAYLYAADCLLIPPTDEPLRRFRRTVLPMKVFMYLAAERSILAPLLPDILEVLTDGTTARLVAPQEIAAAGAALAEILSNRELAERLSENARAAASRYTWSARAQRIARFMEWTLIEDPIGRSASG